MSVPKDLMAILACPKCKGDVREKSMFIICENCGIAYPVLDGDVPDMLIDDAWEVDKAKRNKYRHDLKL